MPSRSGSPFGSLGTAQGFAAAGGRAAEVGAWPASDSTRTAPRLIARTIAPTTCSERRHFIRVTIHEKLRTDAKICGMSRCVVRGFCVSIDGFGAGPNQSLENPLGVNGPELFESFFKTRTWTRQHGLP